MYKNNVMAPKAILSMHVVIDQRNSCGILKFSKKHVLVPVLNTLYRCIYALGSPV